MENKIREYVEYMLRNDTDDNKKDKIDEITSNLVERYYDLLEKGKTKEEAYRETIAYFDKDNSELVKESDSISKNMDYFDIFLVGALVLAIMAFLLFFVSFLGSIIVLGISMLSYGAGYAIKMHKANQAKDENLDIRSYKKTLRGAFAFLKPTLIIWLVTLSCYFASLVSGLVLFLVSAGMFSGIGSLLELERWMLWLYIGVYLFSFVLGSVSSGFIARKILERVLSFYKKETGSDEFDIKSNLFKVTKEDGVHECQLINVITSIAFPIVLGFILGTNYYLEFESSAGTVLIILSEVAVLIVACIFALKRSNTKLLIVSLINTIINVLFFIFEIVLELDTISYFNEGRTLYLLFITANIVCLVFSFILSTKAEDEHLPSYLIINSINGIAAPFLLATLLSILYRYELHYYSRFNYFILIGGILSLAGIFLSVLKKHKLLYILNIGTIVYLVIKSIQHFLVILNDYSHDNYVFTRLVYYVLLIASFILVIISLILFIVNRSKKKRNS